MEEARANRILASGDKRVSSPIKWRQARRRAVVEFEVPVENDLGEVLCLAAQYVPERVIFKIQLFAGDREPIYRFESDKKHHCPDCQWIVGPHVNRPTDADPHHGEAESELSASDIRAAIRQFARRLNIQGLERIPLPPPPSLQQVLGLEEGDPT
jgi:hypothetical protein